MKESGRREGGVKEGRREGGKRGKEEGSRRRTRSRKRRGCPYLVAVLEMLHLLFPGQLSLLQLGREESRSHDLLPGLHPPNPHPTPSHIYPPTYTHPPTYLLPESGNFLPLFLTPTLSLRGG